MQPSSAYQFNNAPLFTYATPSITTATAPFFSQSLPSPPIITSATGMTSMIVQPQQFMPLPLTMPISQNPQSAPLTPAVMDLLYRQQFQQQQLAVFHSQQQQQVQQHQQQQLEQQLQLQLFQQEKRSQQTSTVTPSNVILSSISSTDSINRPTDAITITSSNQVQELSTPSINLYNSTSTPSVTINNPTSTTEVPPVPPHLRPRPIFDQLPSTTISSNPPLPSSSLPSSLSPKRSSNTLLMPPMFRGSSLPPSATTPLTFIPISTHPSDMTTNALSIQHNKTLEQSIHSLIYSNWRQNVKRNDRSSYRSHIGSLHRKYSPTYEELVDIGAIVMEELMYEYANSKLDYEKMGNKMERNIGEMVEVIQRKKIKLFKQEKNEVDNKKDNESSSDSKNGEKDEEITTDALLALATSSTAELPLSSDQSSKLPIPIQPLSV